MGTSGAFWAGAAAGILGGVVTGGFALMAGWISNRAESRRLLAGERRAAYTQLLTALDRIVIDVLKFETQVRASGTSPELADRAQLAILAFREALYTAQLAASPRMQPLVRKIDAVTMVLFEFVRRDTVDLERLLDPFLRLMYQVPAVFAEEARYEVEVGAAGWWKLRRLEKTDPTPLVSRKLADTLNEILDENEQDEEE